MVTPQQCDHKPNRWTRWAERKTTRSSRRQDAHHGDRTRLPMLMRKSRSGASVGSRKGAKSTGARSAGIRDDVECQSIFAGSSFRWAPRDCTVNDGRCEESRDSAIDDDGLGDACRRRLFGKQLGEHLGTLGLYRHIPPGAIKGRCASMARLIGTTAPALSISAALSGAGLTIATNAQQALPCAAL